MITLLLSDPACLDEALASAATALVFGQPMQLLVRTPLSESPSALAADLLDTLKQIGLPVYLDQGTPCPDWLAALSPQTADASEQARLLASSQHCLGY